MKDLKQHLNTSNCCNRHQNNIKLHKLSQLFLRINIAHKSQIISPNSQVFRINSICHGHTYITPFTLFRPNFIQSLLKRNFFLATFCFVCLPFFHQHPLDAILSGCLRDQALIFFVVVPTNFTQKTQPIPLINPSPSVTANFGKSCQQHTSGARAQAHTHRRPIHIVGPEHRKVHRQTLIDTGINQT